MWLVPGDRSLQKHRLRGHVPAPLNRLPLCVLRLSPPFRYAPLLILEMLPRPVHNLLGRELMQISDRFRGMRGGMMTNSPRLPVAVARAPLLRGTAR